MQIHKDLYLFCVSKGRLNSIKPFFSSFDKKQLYSSRDPKSEMIQNIDQFSKVFVWGKGSDNGIESLARKAHIPITTLEDGFIRSTSLGSDISKSYSIVIDSKGIYFDPRQESDLEHIFNTYDFAKDIKLMNRVIDIIGTILEFKLSKYNSQKHASIDIKKSDCDKAILVVGQVEDDASMLLGGYGMTNEKLVIQAKENNPNDYIIFKPHPDVVAGNRKGSVNKEILKKCCDMVILHHSIDSCLSIADEVHTITSLCGFDAILRDKKVVTYGMPFYGGWGLTQDKLLCERRKRKLSKHELIAGALLLYPKYLDSKTNRICELETVLKRIKEEQLKYSSSPFYRLARDIRTYILRKLRMTRRKERKIWSEQ